MRNRIALVGLTALALLAIPALAFAAGDPNGAETLAADPAAPITFIWMLVAGFLVFFMQAGFAMVEAGFCRAKNASNLMMKNLLDFVMGSLAYFAVGFAFMYGADKSGLIGFSDFFLSGDAYDVTVYRDFMFQVVFAATAATIVSGAVAERLKFNSYLVYSIVISAFIYPIYGHWVWGGGWLSQMGFHDFAGSGVVHALGGFVGLAGRDGPGTALRQVRQGRQAACDSRPQHPHGRDRRVHPVVRLVRLQPRLHAER